MKVWQKRVPASYIIFSQSHYWEMYHLQIKAAQDVLNPWLSVDGAATFHWERLCVWPRVRQRQPCGTLEMSDEDHLHLQCQTELPEGLGLESAKRCWIGYGRCLWHSQYMRMRVELMICVLMWGWNPMGQQIVCPKSCSQAVLILSRGGHVSMEIF